MGFSSKKYQVKVNPEALPRISKAKWLYSSLFQPNMLIWLTLTPYISKWSYAKAASMSILEAANH